jgi:4'-phosphopantetheinyl transferase
MPTGPWLSRLHGFPGKPYELWRIRLDDEEAGKELAILSPSERARAERFVFDRDRRRFSVAHAGLRYLLAGATAESASTLSIASTSSGKPYLASHPRLGFNLSHSGDVALVVIGREMELGVDVELRATVIESLRGLAETYFAPGELAAVTSAPAQLRAATFLRVWTRKEACAKALGLGLSMALDALDVGAEAAQRKVTAPRDGRFVEVDVESVDAGDDVAAAVGTIASYDDIG